MAKTSVVSVGSYRNMNTFKEEAAMARGSFGIKLINGVVRAIDKANKEEQRNRLRAAREAEALGKRLRQIRVREEKENERLDEKMARERERLFLAKQRENEKKLATEEKERQLKLKEEERARVQSEKDVQRNAELLQKEISRRAVAMLDEELSEGNLFFKERCNERRNLRLDYIRRLIK